MLKKKGVPIGTIRIKTKNLQFYSKTKTSWTKTKTHFSNATKAIHLYKQNKNFNILIDKKNPTFLKGMVFPDGSIKGVRINELPNKKKLDKAFSLFAEQLTFHDQDTHDHWDLLFKNKGGTYAYCYDLDKKRDHKKTKFKKVEKFDKIFTKLQTNVTKALNKKNTHVALALHTMLKTHMRVGNEIHFKAHGHKGLTTLKKKDLSIKGNNITFNYLAKDGVPRKIKQAFSATYTKQLKNVLKEKKDNDFVFTSCRNGHPLRGEIFKKAFKEYAGFEFYPHIIRSHYATSQVKNFIKGKRKVSKQEITQLYLSIAHELGHKKFVKKEHQWRDNYSVTVSHYIQPELVEKVKKLIK
jgi:hypothetical protein